MNSLKELVEQDEYKAGVLANSAHQIIFEVGGTSGKWAGHWNNRRHFEEIGGKL